MKGHRLGRIRQASSLGGYVAECECKHSYFGVFHQSDIKDQHKLHKAEVEREAVQPIIWLGLDEEELTLIEDVAYSFVKSGNDPDRDKWQAIIRTIDQVRAGDWVPE